MLKLTVLLIFLSAALLAVACNNQTANTTNQANTAATKTAATPAPAQTADQLAKGRELYMTNCSKCHKETGVGGIVEIEGKKIKADDLTSDRRKKMADDKIIKVMIDGVEDEGMPSFKDKLSEAEMREVVRFIRTDIQKLSEAPAAANASAQ